MSEEDVVIAQRRGRLGLITLNRPRAVNALDIRMIRRMDQTLEDFARDDSVTAVAVVGAGTRGLCAGGDVRALYDACTRDPESGLGFFREEYALDHRISQYPKPYVPIMSGLVLGGGVGIAAPGSHRVATDSTRTGMPETGIGFSPDVAGSHYLAQAPGRIGVHLALTGQHIGGADAIHAGLADFYVPDAAVEDLLHGLEEARDADHVTRIIRRFETERPASALETARSWIDAAYAPSSVEEIRDALRELVRADPENDAAAAALAAVERNSPTGLKTALEAVTRAGSLSVAQTLEQDFRTSGHAIYGHDMAEGIRAQVVDKDRDPHWEPATLEEVEREAVLAFFEPIPGQADLGLEDASETEATSPDGASEDQRTAGIRPAQDEENA